MSDMKAKVPDSTLKQAVDQAAAATAAAHKGALASDAFAEQPAAQKKFYENK